ncbi:MAG: PLDc_N domain-containing protein [Chloroflexi bacterium]|nr:MAG: PLDc_N domain-containing protein [Chloroflexota bacterium]
MGHRGASRLLLRQPVCISPPPHEQGRRGRGGRRHRGRGRSFPGGSQAGCARPHQGDLRAGGRWDVRPVWRMAPHPDPAPRDRETLGGDLIKFIVEVLLAIFLHPVAFVLCIIDIVNRKDLGGGWKVLWIIITFFWGIGPILYILLGRGKFW